jgi:hypothetical protein
MSLFHVSAKRGSAAYLRVMDGVTEGTCCAGIPRALRILRPEAGKIEVQKAIKG